MNDILLLEDGFALLLEQGVDNLLLETNLGSVTTLASHVTAGADVVLVKLKSGKLVEPLRLKNG